MVWFERLELPTTESIHCQQRNPQDLATKSNHTNLILSSLVLSNPIALEDSRLLIIGFPQGQAVHLGLKLPRLPKKRKHGNSFKHNILFGSEKAVKSKSMCEVSPQPESNTCPALHLKQMPDALKPKCASKKCSAFQIKNSNYLNLSDLIPSCIPCWCLNHVHSSFATFQDPGDQERPSMCKRKVSAQIAKYCKNIRKRILLQRTRSVSKLLVPHEIRFAHSHN